MKFGTIATNERQQAKIYINASELRINNLQEVKHSESQMDRKKSQPAQFKRENYKCVRTKVGAKAIRRDI